MAERPVDDCVSSVAGQKRVMADQLLGLRSLIGIEAEPEGKEDEPVLES